MGYAVKMLDSCRFAVCFDAVFSCRRNGENRIQSLKEKLHVVFENRRRNVSSDK